MGYTSRRYALAKRNLHEEINRFVVLANSERFTVTDLCEQFGISRKTAYKHLEPTKKRAAARDAARFEGDYLATRSVTTQSSRTASERSSPSLAKVSSRFLPG